MAKIKLTKAMLETARKAAEAEVVDNDRPPANATLNFPVSQHIALAAYLVESDKVERVPAGLDTLQPLKDSDPKKWNVFKAQNPTVTFRLEDRSERGFPRIVTGYLSGRVVAQFVAMPSKQEVMEAQAG